MTQTRAVPTFGQAVGEAQTVLRAAIVDVLQEAGTTFERWVVLNSLVTRGAAVARDELLRELAYGLQTDTGAISDLLDRLASEGFVGPADRAAPDASSLVELTDEGRVLHTALRETVRHTNAALLDGLDPAEVEITIAVLRAVTERAGVFRAHGSTRPIGRGGK
jgi:DNA-binding MarR family transcriptional regulator